MTTALTGEYWYQSSAAPHSTAVLTVRSFGSQMVCVGVPLFCVELAAPMGQRLNLRSQNGSLLNWPHGMGPRDEPSQALHPMAQPFENPGSTAGQQ